MPVYKDEERGTLYVRCYYEDFTGKKKQIKKRGFKLQREAKEWEADFLRKQKGSTNMTFRSMYEIYIEDIGHSPNYFKHLLPPVSKQASGSGGYDAEPAQVGNSNCRCI